MLAFRFSDIIYTQGHPSSTTPPITERLFLWTKHPGKYWGLNHSHPGSEGIYSSQGKANPELPLHQVLRS